MLPNASVTRKETEEKKAGLFSRFSKSESAAATAILAILLLGFVFTVISVVKLGYVPEWKSAAEHDNTYDIWDDMSGVKIRVDMLSNLMESGNYSPNSFSSTVPFNIGGGEVLVFEPSKSNGRLELNTERCKMTILNPHYDFECNGISCSLGNRQYPDQVFRYENGALILADGKSSIMKQSPIFTIEENETKNGNYTVAIRLVRLLGKPNSVSSNSIIPLRLTGWETTPIYDSNNSNNTSIETLDLTITTKYPDAWFVYFNETAQDKGLEYGRDYDIKLYPNFVRFSFLSNNNKTLERLYLSEAVISAEIIPFRYQNMMKLNQWYCFDTVSDTRIDLYRLRDYGSPVDLSIQNTQALSKYSPSSNIFTHDLKNNPLESVFGFSSFTEFESQPSSAKILMIYRLPDLNNPPYMIFTGNALDPLTEDNGNSWYLYTKTVSAASINDPSDLGFYLKIDAENGRKIDIDYLGVYLS
ncbi:MAG: hypothetical protein ACOX79_00750 [Methanosarcina sp.]|jgi:hypothetical protein